MKDVLDKGMNDVLNGGIQEGRPSGPIPWAAEFLAKIAGGLLFLMMIHVCVDVVARLLKLSLVGTNEMVAAYYMIAIIFLPMGYVALIGANIAVDLFTSNLKGRGLFIITLLGDVLSLMVSGLWLWQAIRAALRSTEITERWIVGNMLLDIWPGRWILVVSLLLLILVLFRSILSTTWTMLSFAVPPEALQQPLPISVDIDPLQRS